MKHILSLFIAGAFLLPSWVSGQTIDILSAEEAAERITQDRMDGYFEKVRPLEVSIQLKDATLGKLSQEEAIKKLKEGLKKEVAEPGEKNREILMESMETALQLSQPFTEKYRLPDTIFIGLLKGKVYGERTFFTRENGIFVPAGLVNREFQGSLIEVLIHEIFHIQSRYHPELQEELYKEIGFLPLDTVPEMDSAFRERMLVNPDGTDWQFYIPLIQESDTVWAYPMVVSNEGQFNPNKPQFFAYLQFQLYALEKTEDGYVVSYSDNLKGLDAAWMPVFFDQIEDNTQYIIHPDEIIADNFILLSKIKGNREYKELSEDGKNLLQRLAAVYEVELEEFEVK